MSQHAVARLVFNSPLRAPTTSMAKYLSPDEIAVLFDEMHKANGCKPDAADVQKRVPNPVCVFGKIKTYPVEDPTVWQFLALVRGHWSLDLEIFLAVRLVCRVAGIPMDLSTVIYVLVMGTPLPLPGFQLRLVPDWIREEHEVTRERPEDQVWNYPAGLCPFEVLKLVKAQRRAEWHVVVQTLEEKSK